MSLNPRHKKRRPRTSFFVEVVGRGNLNRLSKLLICNINVFFGFWLEYQLEYCTLFDHLFAFDLTTDCIGVN